jgi:hypothetical protein
MKMNESTNKKKNWLKIIIENLIDFILIWK